jgi:benzil reductase ((S)-benzoin forming)
MRVALLTGGSRGLGLALRAVLTTRGFRVLEFSRTSPHEFSVRVDLSSPERSLEAVVMALSTLRNEHLEELVVINNAATLEPIGPAYRKSRSAVLANLNTNYTSAILILTEIVSHFQDTACRKVLANVSAGAASNGYFGWSLYCAAKAGVENFIRALAIEQDAEAHPFFAINVDPGNVDTDMQATVRSSSPADFLAIERFVRRKEQGELMSPTDAAVAFCRILELPSLSNGARYDVRDHAA